MLCYVISAVVVEKLPSPLSILEDKVEKQMCSQAKRFDSLPEQTVMLCYVISSYVMLCYFSWKTKWKN